ncbi:MAG: hypothetical protein WDN03_05055 [Rhizomicrobium sp.]
MRIRIGLAVVGLALGLAACDSLNGDPFGDDGGASVATAPNGCTPSGCPDAPRFCVARGYQPGTDRYQRCLASVQENLRRGNR